MATNTLIIGDRVKIESPGRHWGGWGDVIDVGLRRTQVRNTDGVMVVRSLWDDTGGHMGSGILLEGRYRIEDVRNRTKIRSEVLKNISRAFKAEGIPLASPRVRIEQV